MSNPEVQRGTGSKEKKSKLLRLALLGVVGVFILAALANL